MCLKKVLIGSSLLCAGALSLNAQSFIPPNMDFESGTTADWTYYTGTVASGHVFTLAAGPAITGLHTITSGSGTDTYGGFPVVGAGLYSLKLSYDTIDNNADAASYNIHVPVGGSYELIYQYAAVLQDAAHTSGILPVFEVSAIDSASGLALPTGALSVTPQSSGFMLSSTGTDVKYKSWTTESLDLSGYGGHTVTVKFTVASCATAAHFGYAYVDVTGVFATSYLIPSTAPTVTMDAPVGYAAYEWTDAATFMASLGTTSSVTIPAPTTTTNYAVTLTPAAGHGTVDTFYTTVSISSSLSASAVSTFGTFNVYPNPTAGSLNIKWANQQTGLAEMQITDVTGRIVSKSALKLNTTTGETKMDLGNLADGVYSVTIKSDNINYSGKVVIQK